MNGIFSRTLSAGLGAVNCFARFGLNPIGFLTNHMSKERKFFMLRFLIFRYYTFLFIKTPRSVRFINFFIFFY